MERKGDSYKTFYDAVQNMDGRLHIIENRIPVEQQIEYIIYTFNVRKRLRKKLNDIDYDGFMEKLEHVDFSIKEKKRILTILASSSEVRAYRLLEQYAQNPDEELVHWASMALLQSRMTIESELSGEKQVYLSTGLGGKGEKLRLYVLILSSQKEPFADYQRKVIEKEFMYFLLKNDCEIERLNINDQYVELVFLLPIVVNIKKMLDIIVEECNQYGNFLAKSYLMTNVKELSQDEINQRLSKYWKS